MLRIVRAKSFAHNQLNPIRCFAQKIKQPSSDSLGIAEVSGKEVAGERLADQGENVLSKYEFATGKRNQLANQDHIQITSFGSVRFDSANRPEYHGQFDESNLRRSNEFQEIESHFNFYDNQKLNESTETKASPVNTNAAVVEHTAPEVTKPDLPPLNDYSNIDLKSFKQRSGSRLKSSQASSQLASNQFYYGDDWKDWLRNDKNWRMKLQILPGQVNDKSQSDRNDVANPFTIVSPLKSFDEIKEELRDTEEQLESIDEAPIDTASDTAEPIDRTSKPEVKTNRTAFDFAKEFQQKLRDSGGPSADDVMNAKYGKALKLDSKGFHVYTNQVLNLLELNRSDQLLYLESQILINSDDLLAINKPYSLICPGEHRSEGNGLALADIMDELAQMVFKESSAENKLYPVHRLDRDTTGVLLLAKNLDTAKRLHQMFQERRVLKKYVAITKSAVSPSQGLIDIPMEERTVDGKRRMELAPRLNDKYRQVIRSSVNAKRAVTEYKVIGQKGNACLVEIKPVTGVKHQIRAHLGLGLRAPILGDHKYSELKRIVPQKLPSDMLQSLRLRQSKVRTIPMHLHCLQIVLPLFSSSGNDLYIRAKPPPHFVQNLASLGLKL
jgi:23S rRNA-/tRNA-specific pseudouridylate synthase